MSYRLMFILTALVALVFGIGYLVVPTRALQLFGVDEYASTRLVMQFFGTALLTVGLVVWFAKNVTDAGAQKGMGIALLIGNLAGLIVAVIGAFTGIIRSLSWLPILIYVLLALGYAFLVFLKPRTNL